MCGYNYGCGAALACVILHEDYAHVATLMRMYTYKMTSAKKSNVAQTSCSPLCGPNHEDYVARTQKHVV